VATSQPLLDELEHTLRAKFALGPAGMAFLEQLRLRVRIVETTPLSSPVSRDADDDRGLATAVAAGAAVIMTGDQDLPITGRYSGIDIVSPREFLSRLSP
jgi:predicted nucleic acid-binding protein